MTTTEKIQNINRVLHMHFTVHPGSAPVPAKHFMDVFIKEGIFSADHKEGLPICNLLRNLDKSRQLNQLPYVIAERKAQNTNWYFGPAQSFHLVSNHVKAPVAKTKQPSTSSKPRSQSDEYYILDLCDEVLQQPAERQHRFSFLVGDPNTKGICSPLPVDAWYELLNLVIEFNERQHSETVKLFDRRMTVSGITRGEQRRRYDERKRSVLPQHGIQVLDLSYAHFLHNAGKRLLRTRDQDLAVIRTKIQPYLKPRPVA